MSTAKPTLDQKPALMANIGISYAVIKEAQKEVLKLEKSLAPEIETIVKTFGAGPHKMPLPVQVQDPNGAPGTLITVTKTYFASFRKAGDVWSVSATDADAIT